MPGAAPAETQEGPRDGPRDVSPGYAIPVPCGYATPSGVPLITPTYTTPVIIRHLSMDEEGTGSHPPNTSSSVRALACEGAGRQWLGRVWGFKEHIIRLLKPFLVIFDI